MQNVDKLSYHRAVTTGTTLQLTAKISKLDEDAPRRRRQFEQVTGKRLWEGLE